MTHQPRIAPPPLFRAYPELAKNLPRLSLGDYPTPVQRLEGLGHDNLWIKREDLSSPLYGGNKVRKLEFVLADALRRRGSTDHHHGRDRHQPRPGHGDLLPRTGPGHRLLLFNQPVTSIVRQNLLLFAQATARSSFTRRA